MSGDLVQAFQEYALAFEKSYAADDWSDVAACLAPDVIWALGGAPPPLGGAWQGPEAVLGAIRASVGSFDRRFDAREPRILEGPTVIPGGVHLSWVVTYRRDGLPPFELVGEEWDFFRDGKLEFHRERIANAAETLAFLQRHAERLLPAR